MATPDTRPETTLRLERTFAAPREKVYAAWTTPEALTRWFGPSDDYTIVVDPFEPRPGGRYRIEMRHKGGAVHPITGVYQQLTPPSKLVFTWKWEDAPERGDTLVTVELFEDGTGTRLVLTHERFPDVPVREAHDKGWTASLDRLIRVL